MCINFSIDELNNIDMVKEYDRCMNYFLSCYHNNETIKSYLYHIRFLFFCWNTVYEGDFNRHYAKLPKLSSAEKSLASILSNHLSKYIFDNFIEEKNYILDIVLADMIVTQEWIFGGDIDYYTEMAKKLTLRAKENMPDNPLVKCELDRDYKPNEDEINYIKKVFPSNNWYDQYFKYWLSNRAISTDNATAN